MATFAFNMTKKIHQFGISCLAFISILAVGSGQAQAGSLFVTGHDSDEHTNGDYMSAGLDYLLFGTAKTNADRTGKKIAYINDESFYRSSVSSELSSFGWTVSTFDISNLSNAFTGGFDVIMTGSGGSSPGNALSSALAAAASSFTSYFNAGGSLYVNTDQGEGQSFYSFIPSFGTAANNTIATSGAFTPTTAGLGIGLTNTIVDADITHSFYTGVDTSIFTVFEVTDTAVFGNNAPHPAPVAFGLRGGTIGGGGFQGGGQSVPEPASITGLMMIGAFGAGSMLKRKNEQKATAKA